ncbi:MAG: hypothetical protein ABMA13_18160 [Chthoniobacteraceae bacterium]
MSDKRKFSFPLATLLREADKLQNAIDEPAYLVKMKARLGDDVSTEFAALIASTRTELGKQTSKTGDASAMTGEQDDAVSELERLTAGARRTAGLAFPGQALLRAEFKVGVDTPKTLAAELERAAAISAACVKYATQLAAQGWIAADTTELNTVIAACSGTDTEQEAAYAERHGLTDSLTAAANALYKGCLRVQNGARLAWPSTKPDTATPRERFLLDSFPPRDRSQPDGGTQPPPAAGGGAPPGGGGTPG